MSQWPSTDVRRRSARRRCASSLTTGHFAQLEESAGVSHASRTLGPMHPRDLSPPVRSRRWGRLEASSGGVIGSILALSCCRFSPADTILSLISAPGGGPGGRRAAAPAAGPPARVVLPRCCLLRRQVPEHVPSRRGSLVNPLAAARSESGPCACRVSCARSNRSAPSTAKRCYTGCGRGLGDPADRDSVAESSFGELLGVQASCAGQLARWWCERTLS